MGGGIDLTRREGKERWRGGLGEGRLGNVHNLPCLRLMLLAVKSYIGLALDLSKKFNVVVLNVFSRVRVGGTFKE